MRYYLFSILVITAIHSSHSINDGCSPFNKTGEPRFTQTLAKIDFVPVHQYIKILCCAGGVDSILWYRLEQAKWKMYPWDSKAQLQPQNQTIQITSTEDSDNTKFKCVLIKNGIPVMENILELHVVRCDTLPRGPIVTRPYPVNPVIDNFGETVTIPCTGYFGCSSSGPEAQFERNVIWQIKGMKMDISKVDSRYVTSGYKSPGADLISSNLTIKSVEEQDMERTFVCHLYSPQIHKKPKAIEIHIVKKEKPSYVMIIVICSVCVSLILLVIVIVCCLRRCYGPQIRVYVSSRFKIFAQKPIKGDGLDFNAFIYHASEDTSHAEEIQKELEKKNFKTKLSNEILGNEMELTAIASTIKKSALVLFVYSQNLRDDTVANVVITSLIHDKLEKTIIFIEIDHYNPEDVMNWTKGTKKDLIKFKDDDELQEDGSNDNEDEESDNKNEIDLKFWKALPNFKYPTNTASERQKKNFWCSLSNKIPKFEYQVEKENKEKRSSINRSAKSRSSSSTSPLLDSPMPSPNDIEIQNSANRSPYTEMSHTFSYDDQIARQRVHNNSVESGNDQNASVFINVDVDVYQNGEYPNEDSDEQKSGASIEQYPEVGIDKRPLSAKSSNGEDTVFTMSAEEPTSATNVGTSHEHANTNDHYQNKVKGTTYSGYIQETSGTPSGEENKTGRLAQNNSLHVEIGGIKGQNGSCSSPESGYTSLSPRLDVENSEEWAKEQVEIRMQNNHQIV